MPERTVHRVEGVGCQRPADDDRQFQPRTFERAAQRVQDSLIDIARCDIKYETDDNPEHERDTDNGYRVLHVQPDSMLHKVLRIIPQQWDTSVLTNPDVDNEYAVRISKDCGGGILVHATMWVQDSRLQQVFVGHSSLSEDGDPVQVTGLSPLTESCHLARVFRFFERSIMRAYARTIDEDAIVSDFLGTRNSVPIENLPPCNRLDLGRMSSKKDWAEVRGKTTQEVKDNVRVVQNKLQEQPETQGDGDSNTPSLKELDSDDDEKGDIRFV